MINPIVLLIIIERPISITNNSTDDFDCNTATRDYLATEMMLSGTPREAIIHHFWIIRNHRLP